MSRRPDDDETWLAPFGALDRRVARWSLALRRDGALAAVLVFRGTEQQVMEWFEHHARRVIWTPDLVKPFVFRRSPQHLLGLRADGVLLRAAEPYAWPFNRGRTTLAWDQVTVYAAQESGWTPVRLGDDFFVMGALPAEQLRAAQAALVSRSEAPTE